jgi:PAS domain S-box-containing protein
MPHSADFADRLPVGIFRVDHGRRYVYVNAQAARLAGRSAADFLGKTPLEVTGNAGLMAFVTAQSERVFGTGRPAEYEMPEQFNPTARLLVRLIPEFGPDGAVETALGVVTDLTAVRTAEVRRCFSRSQPTPRPPPADPPRRWPTGSEPAGFVRKPFRVQELLATLRWGGRPYPGRDRRRIMGAPRRLP